MKLLTVIMLIALALLPVGFRLALAVQVGPSREYGLYATSYRPGRYYVAIERR